MIIHSNRRLSDRYLDTTQASLPPMRPETINGNRASADIASADWPSPMQRRNPFPCTPDPTQSCLKNGFDTTLLSPMVFHRQDHGGWGIGFAASHVGSFFRNARKTLPERHPVAIGVSMWRITRVRFPVGSSSCLLHRGLKKKQP